ncbi:MAG: cysteine synthase family protein [Ignavibacteriales bacterium]|nr:MAG: cysteine synthase family protein [Ignavibacteriaceae bacterium]MBW7873937.1 cysteine synthase family protein [Ignavibacteria bacterium]MCZ2143304.1 cysteine synthase family protein [Ignavibacteriales bacterium]OQY76326.1 MAG: cystathionine beta-synthase [Ignavibacteriales bacterium UTCHB3]MBV6444187.1 Cysteine synthase [Ignavibacteriaceae bacterium]
MTFNSNLNLLKAIGRTPCVKLENISKLTGHEVWAKLEFMNPGGSIKDRIALYMIEKAEREGKIKPGDTIIENSSGNTAMGLAIVCRQKGYKLKIVIRDTTSKEKIKMLEIMGVDVIKVDASLPPDNPDSYNNFAAKYAEENPGVFYIDQHNNLDNNEAHYMSTGPEIWQQMNGRIDYFVAGVGTGGTCTGAGRYLKEQDPGIALIGVDPLGSVFYDYFKSKKLVKPSRYLIEGLGDEFLIKTAQLDLLDDMIQVTDKQAIEHTFLLVAQEGILSGGSSGANIYGVFKLARKLRKPSVICTVICDSGYKYMSTIYNDDWLNENNLA